MAARARDRGGVVAVACGRAHVGIVQVLAVAEACAGLRLESAEEGKLLLLMSAVEEEERSDKHDERGPTNCPRDDVTRRRGRRARARVGV